MGASVELLRQTEKGMLRFRNWARWAVGGEYKMISRLGYPGSAAVCGEYRRTSDEGPIDDHIPVNSIDAEAVEEQILKMPAHLCHAVRYYFTGRVPVNCIYRMERMARDHLVGLVEQAARRLG